jgi:hypothetical protein
VRVWHGPSVPPRPTSKPPLARSELVAGGLIFLACFLLFQHAPIQQTGGDDRYSLLLAENLLRHRDLVVVGDRVNTLKGVSPRQY